MQFRTPLADVIQHRAGVLVFDVEQKTRLAELFYPKLYFRACKVKIHAVAACTPQFPLDAAKLLNETALFLFWCFHRKTSCLIFNSSTDAAAWLVNVGGFHFSPPFFSYSNITTWSYHVPYPSGPVHGTALRDLPRSFFKLEHGLLAQLHHGPYIMGGNQQNFPAKKMHQ